MTQLIYGYSSAKTLPLHGLGVNCVDSNPICSNPWGHLPHLIGLGKFALEMVVMARSMNRV